jgi:hypothetical protein
LKVLISLCKLMFLGSNFEIMFLGSHFGSIVSQSQTSFSLSLSR